MNNGHFFQILCSEMRHEVLSVCPAVPQSLSGNKEAPLKCVCVFKIARIQSMLMALACVGSFGLWSLSALKRVFMHRCTSKNNWSCVALLLVDLDQV